MGSLSDFSLFKMADKKRSISPAADLSVVQKEWDEALCPICMEHPHNAVLLLCSSYSKGCRSYVCDTSYRHSNCLDRLRKLKKDTTDSSPERNTLNRRSSNSGAYDIQHEPMEGRNFESSNDRPERVGRAEKLGLQCPLCRGDVLGWKVIDEARQYLNLKPRSCTRESCTFVGNYRELRRHARSVHPRVRPAEVDPSRQHVWRRFVHRREHDDVISAIRSAMPGAVLLGDYVIETSDSLQVERGTSSDANGPWSSLFFLQMVESMQSLAGWRNRLRPWTRRRRPVGLLGTQVDEDGYGDGDDSLTDDDQLSVFADVAVQGTPTVRRQRRRLTQSRSSRDRL